MERRYRLTGPEDFQRVRRTGTSYSHPLFVAVVCANDLPASRIGVSASRNLGGAVQRNRAKRRLRAAFQPWLAGLPGGWDLLVIARPALLGAAWPDVQAAVRSVLKRSGLQRPG
jgi:ribonuclease P protein component